MENKADNLLTDYLNQRFNAGYDFVQKTPLKVNTVLMANIGDMYIMIDFNNHGDTYGMTFNEFFSYFGKNKKQAAAYANSMVNK